MNINAPYCPTIVDLEASGFGSYSYPIEVGVVTSAGDAFCQLISPPKEWTHWDQEAETLHGITMGVLRQHGQPVYEVANKLNQKLYGTTIYSDGWVVDKPWLIKLFSAAKISMQFTISPIEVLLDESQMNMWQLTKEDIVKELKLTRHRASADAKVIQETFMRIKYGDQRIAS